MNQDPKVPEPLLSSQNRNEAFTLGAALAIAAGWVWHIIEFVVSSSGYPFVHLFGAVNLDNRQMLEAYDGRHVVLAFLMLHHLRTLFNLSFVSQDRSFHDAINSSYSQAELRSLSRREFRMRWALIILLAIVAFTISLAHYLIILILLSLQAFIFMSYTHLFKRALIRDTDKNANKFILVGDGVFYVSLLIMWVIGTCRSGQCPTIVWLGHKAKDSSDILIYLLGCYSAVFVGEITSQQLRSFGLSIKSVLASFDLSDERDPP